MVVFSQVIEIFINSDSLITKRKSKGVHVSCCQMLIIFSEQLQQFTVNEISLFYSHSSFSFCSAFFFSPPLVFFSRMLRLNELPLAALFKRLVFPWVRRGPLCWLSSPLTINNDIFSEDCNSYLESWQRVFAAAYGLCILFLQHKTNLPIFTSMITHVQALMWCIWVSSNRLGSIWPASWPNRCANSLLGR